MLHRLTPVVVALTVAACSSAPPTREYELRGQILAVQPERNELLIKHEAVKGFMPAMTMPFKVKNPDLMSGRQPGDLVTATLVVGDVEAYLSTITPTGHAALDLPAAPSDAQQILAPGDQVRDAELIDQDGRRRRFADLRGHRVALTFIYTRCPLVEFCPMMDRLFRAVQQMIKSTPELADARLLTMTMDPGFDTPAVLKAHAETRGADPAVWSYVTADAEDAAAFPSQFGLYVERNSERPTDIVHNLVTVVIDANGRLARRHTGNDWTPAQLVSDLKAAPAAAN